MPILHFSGQFKFQLPYFNNNPENDASKPNSYDLQLNDEKLKVKFDKNLSPEEVHKRLLCDPTKYFEFEFSNVIVSRISYDDGSNTDESNVNEPILSKYVFLRGLLVDLAPHLQRGQLYAADVRVTDTLIGKLRKGIQSNVIRSIRIVGNEKRRNKLFHYSAYFETDLYDVFKLEDPRISEENSRFLRELKDLNLKIYFSLSRYDITTNEGEVYGYIGAHTPLTTNEGLLIRNRKLYLSEEILNSEDPSHQDIINDFQIDPQNESTFPRATFEIQQNNALLILRYMDIMPFVDYNYNTLDYQYYITLSASDEKSNDHLNKRVKIDRSYEEMKKSGGIKVIKIFDSQYFNFDNISVAIEAGRIESSIIKLLAEPEWTIILDEDECIKMNSNETRRVTGQIFHKNKKDVGKQILSLEELGNDSSPLVARFEKKEIESNDGSFELNVISHNLENSEEIDDPITNGKLREELPWDRYYGNSLSIELKNSGIQNAILIFMVRVIHKVIDENDTSIEQIKKLFSYYRRYYPWIHVRIENCNYNQFFGFGDDIGKMVVSNIGNIIARLRLDDDNWYKMPRSRDFPENGRNVIENLFNRTRTANK